MPVELPVEVTQALDTWLSHHDRVAPELIEGVYVVGSAALGDWWPGSDIDIVACTSGPATAAEVERLHAAFAASAAALDGTVTVDGPIVAWADLAAPPTAVLRPWALDGEFRHDRHCFVINPVTWFTLAEYGVAVRGPDPKQLDVHLDEVDRRRWVRDNVDSYWRGVRDQLLGVLDQDADRNEFAVATTAWCVLGVARMWFTATTGGVTSKSAAGLWVSQRLPDHAEAIDMAIRIRSGEGPSTIDRAAIRSTVDAMGAMFEAI